jgi:hypothetical protein
LREWLVSGDQRPMSFSAAVIEHFVEQARHCETYGSPFMARLLEVLGRDIEAGGPPADLVAGWPPTAMRTSSTRWSSAHHMLERCEAY